MSIFTQYFNNVLLLTVKNNCVKMIPLKTCGWKMKPSQENEDEEMCTTQSMYDMQYHTVMYYFVELNCLIFCYMHSLMVVIIKSQNCNIHAIGCNCMQYPIFRK